VGSDLHCLCVKTNAIKPNTVKSVRVAGTLCRCCNVSPVPNWWVFV